MPQLEFVEPGADATLNVMLYGAPKTGKTMAAASAPGPILYINADRPNALRMARAKYGEAIFEVKFTGLQTMIDVTNELIENSDKWGSVVVDTVGELYTKLVDDLSGRALRASLPLRGDAGVHLERFLRQLCDFPVNAVFVAHEYLVEDDEQAERVPFVTSKSGSSAFAGKLAGMVDVIGYAGVVFSDAEDEPNKYLAQLIPANGRRGGSRFASLGKAREMDISEWIEQVLSETGELAGAKE